MKTRVISGAVLVVLLAAVLLFGGPVLLIALALCSLAGVREMYRALGVLEDGKGVSPVAVAGFLAVVLYYLTIGFTGARFYGGMAAGAVILIMGTYVAAFSGVKSEQAVGAVFGFFYVAFMLGFIYLIRTEEDGLFRVIPVFLSSWIADTCAYFTGVLIGKHKMTPVLSPKKTVEGAAGGVLGAGLSGVIFSLLTEGGAHMPQYFLICAAAAVISIFGDLAASAVKRDRGIKDYGALIPGHGGILDRFDSVIFTAPVIYFLTQILIYKGV